MKPSGVAADFAVLAILSVGGLMTVDQLSREAGLTSWSTRAAVARLEARGLIVDSQRQGRWQITDRGRGAWTVKGKRFTL
ncbi:MarR family transcriptional regulator [Nocardia terrae]|uniref:MarR family transcriptional regulator n=1 Tax=Nocardia terrae TaxID=2675851 RepID=UPI0038B33EED